MITFFLCLLASIVFYTLGKTFSHQPQSVMVPREYRKAAQHAADTSMQQQVVVFDGSTYSILKANNQHAATGNIVFVATPGDIEKSIKVGDCLRPNLSRIGDSVREGDIMVGGIMLAADS